jgi:hypothetical protein
MKVEPPSSCASLLSVVMSAMGTSTPSLLQRHWLTTVSRSMSNWKTLCERSPGVAVGVSSSRLASPRASSAFCGVKAAPAASRRRRLCPSSSNPSSVFLYTSTPEPRTR